jgi:glutathione-regulated potassium-efflux system ancillary protein KefG
MYLSAFQPYYLPHLISFIEAPGGMRRRALGGTLARVLLLFAHPALEKSRVHARMVRALPHGITFHDLYEAYPDFAVDVPAEQELLLAHDVIVMQHPFYWYSTPPMIKQWEDLVLEHGWAYGSQGTNLRGKAILNVVTTGGPAAAYSHEGFNRFTVREFLASLEQTAALCGMTFLPPYAFHGTHRMDLPDIEKAAATYTSLMEALRDDRIDLTAAVKFSSLNEALAAEASGERATVPS